MRLMRASIVVGALLSGVFASASDARDRHHPWLPHFVPNSLQFWDNSKSWTTNYGPAYRDTVEKIENFVPCTGHYALCFHSGPEPLPCELERGGRFADCTCTIEDGVNFVLISSILNYRVYLDTIDQCGADGSGCSGEPDKAPVCKAIADGRLIREADYISTYSPEAQTSIETTLANGPDDPEVTICPKGPYAGCMTAPCKATGAGDAVCSCPVFYGPFQLTQADAQCTLDDRLVWSSAYSPALDRPQ